MKAFLSAVAVPLPLKMDPFPSKTTLAQNTKATELHIEDGKRSNGSQAKSKKTAQPLAFLLAPL